MHVSKLKEIEKLNRTQKLLMWVTPLLEDVFIILSLSWRSGAALSNGLHDLCFSPGNV